jgi:hypothetical protein
MNQSRTLTVVATESKDHEHRICPTTLVTLVDRNALADHVSFTAERPVAGASPRRRCGGNIPQAPAFR